MNIDGVTTKGINGCNDDALRLDEEFIGRIILTVDSLQRRRKTVVGIAIA